MKIKFLSLFLISFSFTLFNSEVTIAQERLNGYHIGNSLTWDTRPPYMVPVFESENFNASQGYHIRCGGSATFIAANPNDTCINPPTPFGIWNNALANFEWDYVTIQAFYGGTGISETEAVNTLIDRATENTANLDTIFYLYAPWPSVSNSKSYTERWNLPYSDPNSNLILSRDFFDYWFDSVTQSNPEQTIRYIPAGEVYAELDSILQANPVGTFASTYDLYRDAVHMSSLEGQYVAHATTLAVILKKNPQDLTFPRINPIPGAFNGLFADVNPEFKAIADSAIWSTVTSDSRTGVIVSEPQFNGLLAILIGIFFLLKKK